MTTQGAIAELNDSTFHLLGDELLRRLEPRYRSLRTHGVNEHGDAIRGQPDSYVGDSAQSCLIAICYTVQESGWWRKVLSDVKEVRSACTNVTEIVVVVARDVDRDGPRRNRDEGGWLGAARAAAGVTLRIIDRKELAAYLDNEHQDLRFRYLGIPYSRLSHAGIVASAQSETRRTIGEITESGRFDALHYIVRSADRDLYRFWQASFNQELASDKPRSRLIPLVADSGLGSMRAFAEAQRQ